MPDPAPQPYRSSAQADRPAFALPLADSHGWMRHGLTSPEEGHAGAEIWLKGVLFNKTPEKLAASLLDSRNSVSDVLADVDGHFAMVVQAAGRTVLVTDPICSIPLAYRLHNNGVWQITDRAADLVREGDLASSSPEAVLALAMAGFTIGEDRLVPDISVLMPGSWAVLGSGGACKTGQYYTYLPAGEEDSDLTLDARLADVTMRVLEKTVRSIGGRTIVVPLSAGLDSRLIVTGLKELGYRDVICVSYGRTGNHEAAMAERIARELGYPWHFFPHLPSQQATYFRSEECARFTRFAETLRAMPFQQDFAAVKHFVHTGVVPGDAVYINGQSGDYISGNHIPASLSDPDRLAKASADPEAGWERILDALIGKHFDLWKGLKTESNLREIRHRLRRRIEARGQQPGDPRKDYEIFETTEFEDRQCKYVVQGQRTYEWWGHEWRLPLWDREYLDFWSRVPLRHKTRQALYRDMLVRRNWGGVWGEGWWAQRRIVPTWIKPLRWCAKAAHAPLGADKWHQFEKRWFDWWTDIVCNYAAAPYSWVIRSRQGHRNGLAWHADMYLRRKGLAGREPGTFRY